MKFDRKQVITIIIISLMAQTSSWVHMYQLCVWRRRGLCLKALLNVCLCHYGRCLIPFVQSSFFSWHYLTWTSPTDYLHVKGCAATSNKFSVSNDIVKDCRQGCALTLNQDLKSEHLYDWKWWSMYCDLDTCFKIRDQCHCGTLQKFGPGVWSLYSLSLVLYEFTVYRQWTWTI